MIVETLATGSTRWRLLSLLGTLSVLAILLGACTSRSEGGDTPAPEATATPQATAEASHVHDLGPLFAPPTESEIAAVKEDWASRNPVVEEWRVDDAAKVNGFEIWVVSHIVDGTRHYGAVRFPRNYTPEGSFPVLVVNHGGQEGFILESMLDTFDEFIGDACLSDNFFYVLPSYRGEMLTSSNLGIYQSGGTMSIMDRDVDDAIALLDGVLANIPQVDPERVGVWGLSRGAGVSLLMAVRDERVKVVSILYGFSDYMMPYYHRVLQSMVDAGATNLQHPLMPLILAYINREAPLRDARITLLQRSPVYFADQLPAIQFHHGSADTVAPIEHSERLNEALEALGAAAPDYEYYRYEGGEHSASSLPGSGERTAEILCGELVP